MKSWVGPSNCTQWWSYIFWIGMWRKMSFIIIFGAGHHHFLNAIIYNVNLAKKRSKITKIRKKTITFYTEVPWRPHHTTELHFENSFRTYPYWPCLGCHWPCTLWPKWPKMAILAILYMANGNPDMVNMGMSWKSFKNVALWCGVDILGLLYKKLWSFFLIFVILDRFLAKFTL